MRGMRMRHMHQLATTTAGPRLTAAGAPAAAPIRISILRLLAERPMHGYELIQEFEQRTGGRWRPSPGSGLPDAGPARGRGARPVDRRRRPQAVRADRRRAHVARRAPGRRSDARRGSTAATGRRGDLRRLAAEIVGQLRQLGRFGIAGPARPGPGHPDPHPRRALRGAGRSPGRRAHRPTTSRPDPSEGSCTPRVAREPSDAAQRSMRPDEEVDRAGHGGGDEALQLRARRGSGRRPAVVATTRVRAASSLAARVVLTAWAWTMNAVVVSSSARRCSASPAATTSVGPEVDARGSARPSCATRGARSSGRGTRTTAPGGPCRGGAGGRRASGRRWRT